VDRARLLGNPFAPLAIFALVSAGVVCAYRGTRAAPGPGAGLLIPCGWTFLLALWMEADARRRRRTPCFEFGFLALLALPVSLPWYCLWSRGWWGLPVLLALFAMWALPPFLAVFLWH
jgi:hypothetical protein